MNLPEEVRRSQVRVLRPVDAEPGSEAQIDYGRLGVLGRPGVRAPAHGVGVRDGAENIAFHMRTPIWCRKTAAEVLPACEAVIAGLLVDNALFRLRTAQGVRGLPEEAQPGPAGGCLRQGDRRRGPVLRTVKGILAAGVDVRGDGEAGLMPGTKSRWNLTSSGWAETQDSSLPSTKTASL